ncbi:MAG: hypothetical protein JWO13_2734 [Acidobacteriales bacterium]|nr:hypothetical protein [Terriglobales bacterium]
MIFTPSSKGSFVAGAGFWMLVWASVFKADDLADILRVRRWLSTDRCLDWVRNHKSTSLLITEGVNYTTHGISNVLGVTFAMGGTFTNVLVIFLMLPIRAVLRSRSR